MSAQNFCRRAKNSASFDCFRRYATEGFAYRGPLGSHGFAAPPAIVLHALRTFMPTPVLELGRPTLATLESTAFLALGFGAVNGQDFRMRRDPLGRFTLFLISQLVSGSRVSLTQGRAGPAGSGNCRERARVLQSRCGENRIIYRIKQVCRTTIPTCFWILVVSSPTRLWWKRGPVGHFFGQESQRSGEQQKVARFTVPKIFLGAAKIARFNLLLRDKASGNSKGSKIHCAKNFSGSSKDCKIQPLLCDKASGNSKGSKIHCAKKFSARFSLYCATKFLGTAKVARFTVPKKFLGAAKIARFSLYCATKLLGTAKVARFTVPKIFLGAAKIARFSLYCVKKLLGTAKLARCTVPKNFWEQQRLQDSIFWEQQRLQDSNLYRASKLLGTAKVARFTVPKNFLGAAKIARFSLYCATKLLGTAKVARFTVPKNFLGDWKVNVSKPAPIHGEHQSPAQWPHTRILPGKNPVNIRKHDRLHGAKPSLNIAPPFFPLI